MLVDWQKDPYVRVAAALVVGVGALSALARGLASGDRGYSASYERKARALVRQATQLAHVAQQDTDPAVALQHATQATTYLEVALQLVDAATLQRGAEVDVHALAERLRRRQGSCLGAVTPSAPPPAGATAAASAARNP